VGSCEHVACPRSVQTSCHIIGEDAGWQLRSPSSRICWISRGTPGEHKSHGSRIGAGRAAEHSGACALAEAGFQAYVVDPTSSSVGRHWQPPKTVQSIEVILSCSYVPAASQGRRFVASDVAQLCRHFRGWCDVMALPHRRDNALWPHAIAEVARSGGGRLPVKRIAMLLPCYCHVDEI
jgi:hypothetical protein